MSTAWLLLLFPFILRASTDTPNRLVEKLSMFTTPDTGTKNNVTHTMKEQVTMTPVDTDKKNPFRTPQSNASCDPNVYSFVETYLTTKEWKQTLQSIDDHVEELYLSNSNFTGEHPEEFKRFKNLKILDLEYCSISIDQLTALSEVLPTTVSIYKPTITIEKSYPVRKKRRMCCSCPLS